MGEPDNELSSPPNGADRSAHQRDVLVNLDKLIQHVLDPQPHKHTAWEGLWRGLNSSVVLAVIGAVAVAVVAPMWQDRQAQREEDLKRTEARLSRKAEALKEFSSIFPKSLTLARDMTRILIARKDEDKERYRQLTAAYLQLETPDGLCLRTASMFKAEGVFKQAQKLTYVMDRLLALGEREEQAKFKDPKDVDNALTKLAKEADELQQEIIVKMATEVRNELSGR